MKLTKKTRVFVTGAGGMLGEAVYEHLKNKVTLLPTSRTAHDPFLIKLDVSDDASVKKAFLKFKPDLVIHLAAITDLEYCERNPKKAWEINVKATEYLANFCQSHSIPMVYIGTGIIFNGKKQKYTELDVPNPTGVYAQSKYAGELAVARIVTKHYILRAGWLMGGGPQKDKKFVSKILQQVRLGETKLSAVADKLGSLSYTPDFVKQMLKVIEQDAYGIYHVACDEVCSRYDIAKEIVKILNRTDISVAKVSSGQYSGMKEYFAPRPSSEGLAPAKLKQMDIYIMRDWKVCLAEYITRWK